MSHHTPATIGRITSGDAAALATFYNSLSPAAIRTFRPLGTSTSVEASQHVVMANATRPEARFDLLAWRQDRIAGWCFLWDLPTAQPFFGLGIADANRGQGLGATLLDRVMQEVRKRALPRVYLTVVKDNSIAWRMYQKQGFVRYDEYLDEADGETYFRMVWHHRPA